jgi:hypothetical protein
MISKDKAPGHFPPHYSLLTNPHRHCGKNEAAGVLGLLATYHPA